MNNATKPTLFVCKLLGGYIKPWILLILKTVSSKSKILNPSPSLTPNTAFFSWAHRLHFQPPCCVRYSHVTKFWSMECGQSDVCLFLIQTLPLRSLCIPPHLPFSIYLLAEWEGRRISISGAPCIKHPGPHMTMWVRALLGVSKHKLTVWVLSLQLWLMKTQNNEPLSYLIILQTVEDCQTLLTQDFSSPVSQLLLLSCIYFHQITFS